jgi:hypothetical protein
MRNGRSALDIVVVGADLVLVLGEQRHGIEVGEIFPLHAAFRIAFLNGRDEFSDERVVVVAAHALLTKAEI